MKISVLIVRCLLAAVLSALWPGTATAELRIEIRQGVDKAVPVAVLPFGWQGEGAAPADVAAVVAADLARSGRFAPLPRGDMLTRPTDGRDVDFDDWRILGTEIVIVGRLIPRAAKISLFSSRCSTCCAGSRCWAIASLRACGSCARRAIA